jgi:hypothetical protein
LLINNGNDEVINPPDLLKVGLIFGGQLERSKQIAINRALFGRISQELEEEQDKEDEVD